MVQFYHKHNTLLNIQIGHSTGEQELPRDFSQETLINTLPETLKSTFEILFFYLFKITNKSNYYNDQALVNGISL